MFKARPIQTKVKHIILEKYLKAWGGIIMYGAKAGIYKALQQGVNAKLHFVYVDCFAGYGSYDGELEDKERGSVQKAVLGSPFIGIQALDSLVEHGRKEGIPIQVNAILIEVRTEAFSALQESLKNNKLDSRVRKTRDFSQLKNGEIALVQADSTSIATDLLAYTTTNYIYAFYFLDPYGPTGIPLGFVKRIISQQRHDTLINMPYQDLHKKSGILSKKQFSATEETLLQNYDEMFGSKDWRSIVYNWVNTPENSKQSEQLELDLANFYSNALKTTDSELSVKSLPLLFSDKDRTMFHLYLTTHDPNGALQMNQIMLDADYIEYHLRWQLKYSKKTHGGQQMSLFEIEEMIPQKTLDRDYTEEIATKILSKFSGKSTNRREIYQYFIDELYLPKEINSAITKLRNAEKVSFSGSVSSLSNKTVIRVFK